MEFPFQIRPEECSWQRQSMISLRPGAHRSERCPIHAEKLLGRDHPEIGIAGNSLRSIASAIGESAFVCRQEPPCDSPEQLFLEAGISSLRGIRRDVSRAVQRRLRGHLQAESAN